MRRNQAGEQPNLPPTPSQEDVVEPKRRRYVTERRVLELSRRLSREEWQVLEFVAAADYATTKQIERACLADGTALARARRARRLLQRLTELGLLYRLERPVGGRGGGSAAAIYTLERAGQRLASLRAGAAETRTRHPEERGQAFLLHTLAVSEHLASLLLYLRATPGVELLSWEGEPRCHRRFNYRGRLERLTPDALVEVIRGAKVVASALEVDRGTEALPTLLRKATTYLHYARLYPKLCPQVVFSFTLPERATRFETELPALARREGVDPRAARRLFIVVVGVEAAVAALAGEEVQP